MEEGAPVASRTRRSHVATLQPERERVSPSDGAVLGDDRDGTGHPSSGQHYHRGVSCTGLAASSVDQVDLTMIRPRCRQCAPLRTALLIGHLCFCNQESRSNKRRPEGMEPYAASKVVRVENAAAVEHAVTAVTAVTALIKAPDDITFYLRFHSGNDYPGSGLTCLSKPCLSTKSIITILHLKKFITLKMSIRPEFYKLRLTCKGQVLSDTDTVANIYETIWKNDEKDLVLHFFALQPTTRMRVNSKNKIQ